MQSQLGEQQSTNGIETVILAVAETIKELKEIPSGHLYARVMSHLSLEQYEQVISTLVRIGLVEKRNDLLRWTGQYE